MQFPNGDLWCVRQIELLDGALEDMRGCKANYFPDLVYRLEIPGVATYGFKGVIPFPEDDRTVILEVGEGFGLDSAVIVSHLDKFGIIYTIRRP